MAEVLTHESFAEALPKEAEKPAPKTGRSPPKDGTCKRCGLDKPVNSLSLCYRCWVLSEIEDREKREGRHWSPGMPHPEWCRCEGLPEHPSEGGGAKGAN